jgi:predicted RNA-binding Zn ribbon-like protein
MSTQADETPAQGDAPLFVGDDLALDFINTAYGLGAGHRDVLVSDESVVDWLRAVGALPDGFTATPKGLLTLARKLRASARLLVEAAVAGEPADPIVVNQVLEAGWRPPALAWEASTQAFRAVPRPGKPDAAGLLAPVAQALTHLLTEVDLGLVRRCEGDHCTLLFHDLTKSHRRRWCSMAGCGNRMKVAAFRARQKNA